MNVHRIEAMESSKVQLSEELEENQAALLNLED